MAIQLEFIDLIIPIATIEAKYAGGWEQCLDDYAYDIGRKVWYDDYLFRDGSMNQMDMKSLVDSWSELGFNTHREEDGKIVEWIDVCVYEHMYGGATRNCNWISYDRNLRAAYLTETDAGKVFGRNDFEVKEWSYK